MYWSLSEANLLKFSYIGDNGKKSKAFRDGSTSILRYSKPYGTNDVVGCGLIISDGTIFFTLNGVNQGN